MLGRRRSSSGGVKTGGDELGFSPIANDAGEFLAEDSADPAPGGCQSPAEVLNTGMTFVKLSTLLRPPPAPEFCREGCRDGILP
jgi:hypothetical protein